MKKVLICARCRSRVYPANKPYLYQCFSHDEDLYLFETIKVAYAEYIESLMKKYSFSMEEATKAEIEYDSYVRRSLNLHVDPLCMEDYLKKNSFRNYSL